MKTSNINNKLQSLMLSPTHNKNHNKNFSQIQKQNSIAPGFQSQIADQGHPFSEQLQNLQFQLMKENKEQLMKIQNIKPQTYDISPHHNLTLLSKNKENIISSSQIKSQLIKQANSQMIIKKIFKITKIQQVKTYQMIAKMSRSQQSQKDITLKVRHNEPINSDNFNKKQVVSNNFRLNQFRDFPLPFKYELDGDNPLKQILIPPLNFVDNEIQNMKTNNKQKMAKNQQKLLIMQKRCKYLLNIPLNFNQAEYFLKFKINLQKNCGLTLHYINKNQQRCKNFKYEIVKLMQNVVRIRCLILVDDKIEKVWKQLQIPLVNDKNVHTPENNQQNYSILEVSINTKSYSLSVIKLNQFDISLNLEHPYEETSYIFIETDPNGVQIKQISLQSGKQFKQTEINVGGCEGQCQLI